MGKNIHKYFLLVMTFVFLGYFVQAYMSERESKNAGTSEKESVRMCKGNDFKVKDIQWHRAGQTNVGSIDTITITNSGEYDCKDIRGIIRFLSQKRTELGKDDIFFSGNIRSEETKTFKSIPLEQLPSANVSDVSVTIVGAEVCQEKGS